MAGIKDVAKRAGVGVGTVSRVLNNSGYVSAEARRKIEDAIRELDYTPNELARNLYHRRSGIVAVLVPNISYPFFADFIGCAEYELYNAGYKMMLCSTDKAHNAETEYLEMLRRRVVDGVITGVHTMNREEYRKIQRPIVALDRYLGEQIPVVTVDHGAGGRLAAETLIANGCRRIIQFHGGEKVESPYHERHREFERVLAENHISCTNCELAWNRFDKEYYRNRIQEIMADEIPYDGIFGVDLVAAECMKTLLQRGKRIPEDVKIVVYDGTYITDTAEPELTAVVQPIEQLARESVRMIADMIEGKKNSDQNVVLDVRLRRGRTTVV